MTGPDPRPPGPVKRPQGLLTYAETAQLLRCSYRTVQRRVASGHLQVFRNGGRSFVTARSIRAYLQANTTETQE